MKLLSTTSIQPDFLSSFKVWLVLLILTVSLLTPATARANGGTPIYNGDIGNFNVYLLISPSPPTPTVPAHLTMVVTKKGTDQPVTAATVLVEPSMLSMPMPGSAGLRFVQMPGRPNQYDVDIPVTMEGDWRLKITIIDPLLGTVLFTADTKVEKSDIPWPIIIALLVALPLLAGLTWFFLFKDESGLDEEDEEEEEDQRKIVGMLKLTCPLKAGK